VSGRQLVEDRLAALVGGLASRLPRKLALALGRGLGRVWGGLDARHVRIAVENMRQAFPYWDEAQCVRTARGVYRHFGQVLLDLLWMQGRSREEVLANVELVGQEHLEQALALGRGILYPTGHVGNWEIHAVAHGWLYAPVSVVARPLDNPALDRRLCALRSMSGNTVIYKKKALARILKTLKEGGGVAMLIDQNVQEKDGIFVDFFGRQAATTTVAAALAVKTGCPLLPVHTVLEADGRCRLIYGPVLSWSRSGDRQRDIAELTQRLTTAVEGWVREQPEQWLWMHRRWKTRPPEDDSTQPSAISDQRSAVRPEQSVDRSRTRASS
jgi:KDO2-lipid IV(A) lauroyltransferase